MEFIWRRILSRGALSANDQSDYVLRNNMAGVRCPDVGLSLRMHPAKFELTHRFHVGSRAHSFIFCRLCVALEPYSDYLSYRYRLAIARSYRQQGSTIIPPPATGAS